ncbi:MAG: hypothetical protein PHO26_10135, partial [Dehalococcoidia bacterium]|nr:hypothetical protein [Dehalococcoidia bacterium]
VFQDTITDSNLIWMDNVTTTAGAITNNVNGCTVNIGNMIVGASVTITFRAQIKTPLAAGVNKVSNQGLVSGSNFASVPTNDPRTLLANDATVTSVTPTDMVEPYKTWALTTDADGNGYPSPGDTLTYTVTLENLGNIAATNVVFTDIPDLNSSLVTSSVTTTSGTVTKGNTAGDGAVAVNVGTIQGGQGTPVTITFAVIVNSPLPAGVTQLSNQGFASGSNFPADPTDDPTDQSYDNPTVTPLTAAPLIEAFKRYELTDDINSDGLPGPGDNLTYIITIANKGNQSADNVTFTDNFATENITLVAGSTITSQGTVISELLTGLAVDVGTMPGGNYTVDISFRVTIKAGATGGISNQGTVTATGGILKLTDDPNTHTIDDKTYASIALGPPELRVTKSALLAVDADNNNIASPGDTLQYIVAINNNGGSAADNVTFTDIVDPNTSVIVGSTTTTQAAIVTENLTTVTAYIGTLEGGMTHSICLVTFRVLVKSPFPIGTTTVANQGRVTAAGVTPVLTDDPNTTPSPDATITNVYPYPVVTATKTELLLIDADGNNVPSPGDNLSYIVNITNSGNTAALAVSFQDTITDANLILADNVSTTQGIITKGNGAGDTEVIVNIGNIAAGTTVIIAFNAGIAPPPLPANVNHVSNQGLVTGTNFSTVLTDDPRTSLEGDPTSTGVTALPFVEPYKTWALTTDADNNGYVSPGDTLTYTIVIENTGNQNAAGVVFTDAPDANSTLVAGSVTTTLGDVTQGNQSGNTEVNVNVGTLSGNHVTATITFRVLVKSPLPPGVTLLSNQGFVSGSNFPSDPTDNPEDESYDNPTDTPLTAAPLIKVSKSYTVSEEFPPVDGIPGPGDNITYVITIANNGSQNAAGVFFADTVDPNTSMVLGSTATSRGTVATENLTYVAVNVGTLLGGGDSAVISFKVTVKNTPGLTIVSNQGNVTGVNFTAVLTDDPGTTKIDDATDTYLAAAVNPDLRVTKTDLLYSDTDANLIPSPGDILQYIITMNNVGNGTANSVVFTDTPDPNTTLVAGSVVSTQGTVVLGNNPGDTSVNVNVGALPAGQSHSVCLVTFRVVVNRPFPSGVPNISNRGAVTGTGFALFTDDPNISGGAGNPTVTNIGLNPAAPTPAPTPVAAPAPAAPASVTSHGSSEGNKQWIPPPVALPNVVVQSASLSAAKATPDTPVTVIANIANRGTVNGSIRVKVYINGEEEAVQSVTVNSGKIKTIQFDITRTQPGIYNVYVGNIPAGSFTVDAFVDPNMVLYVSFFLVLTSLILTVIYIRRRQQGVY